MACNLWSRVRGFFVNLNLFASNSDDPEVKEHERLSTRIYLIAILFIMLIVGIVALAIVRSTNIVVQSPSQTDFEKLSARHSATLNCPCSQLAISYSDFTTVKMQSHQVCVSMFVTQTWIDLVYIDRNTPDNDIRPTLSAFWQTIGALCQLSSTSASNALDQFNAAILLSPTVMNVDIVQTYSETTLAAFISSVRSTLVRSLFSIEQITAGNQLVSGLATNFYAHLAANGLGSDPVLSPRMFDNCSCSSIHGCSRQATVYSLVDGSLNAVPGMLSDCLIVDAVLESSLECYYDMTCITLLHGSFETTIAPLNTRKNMQFRTNSTIQEILDDLMIDEISMFVAFDQFYTQCKPNYCSYISSRRFNIVFAITILSGIYGGLAVLFSFLAPFISKRIMRWRKRHLKTNTVLVPPEPNHTRSLANLLLNLARKVWQLFVTLNLFKSRIPNPRKIPRQRLTTRLFIVILILSTVILGFYIFLSVEPQVIIISNPSLNAYEKLYNEHSTSLECPCSQISVPYGSFLNISFILHQVCSSTLVSPEWLNFTLSFDQAFARNDLTNFFERDFRTVGVPYFQLLAAICSIAQQNIEDALHTLGSTHFINNRVPPKSSFVEQMQILNASFVDSTLTDFLSTKDWLYTIAQANQLLTGLSLNTRMKLENDNITVNMIDSVLAGGLTVTEYLFSVSGPCSCRLNANWCAVVTVLYYTTTSGSPTSRYMPGMDGGCTPFLALLKTHADWWYDRNYIQQIQITFAEGAQNRTSPNLEPLLSSLPTRFISVNWFYSDFETIFNGMFVESWTGNISRFDLFYDQCAPVTCSYTIDARNSLIASFLQLISIVGGLNRALRMIIPILVIFAYAIIEKYRNRRQQQGNE